jgi:glycosyltransferase involved in cell wall biosynthesis
MAPLATACNGLEYAAIRAFGGRKSGSRFARRPAAWQAARVHTSGPLTDVRVALVSMNYRPEHAGIGPYAGQIAEGLVAAGARVSAVAGVPHYPAWRIPAEYRWALRRRERLAGVDVLRLRHYVPSRQSALRRGLYEGTFLAQALTTRLTPPPQIVLAISPSLSSAAAGMRIARRYGVPCVLLVQDLMGAAAAQSGIRGGGTVARLTDRAERSLLSKAAAVAVIHESFVPSVRSMGVAAERIHVVPNWTHIGAATGDRQRVRAEMGWAADETVMLHAGNMGLKQGLEVVVDAARRALKLPHHLRFVLMGDGNQRAHLEQIGAGLPNLTVVPPVPGDGFPDVLNAADVLLVTQRASVLDMSVPSKLTSYFAAGRPVLAAVAPDGGTAVEIERSGAGVLVIPEDPGALLDAALSLRAAPDKRESLGRNGQAYAAARLDRTAALDRITGLIATVLR